MRALEVIDDGCGSGDSDLFRFQLCCVRKPPTSSGTDRCSVTSIVSPDAIPNGIVLRGSNRTVIGCQESDVLGDKDDAFTCAGKYTARTVFGSRPARFIPSQSSYGRLVGTDSLCSIYRTCFLLRAGVLATTGIEFHFPRQSGAARLVAVWSPRLRFVPMRTMVVSAIVRIVQLVSVRV
jgi:hypothetical protein